MKENQLTNYTPNVQSLDSVELVEFMKDREVVRQDARKQLDYEIKKASTKVSNIILWLNIGMLIVTYIAGLVLLFIKTINC